MLPVPDDLTRSEGYLVNLLSAKANKAVTEVELKPTTCKLDCEPSTGGYACSSTQVYGTVDKIYKEDLAP